MSSSPYKYCVLNAVRLRHQTQLAEIVTQLLYKSLHSTQVRYLNRGCSEYWKTLKERVKFANSRQNTDSSDPVSFIQGIDMNPAKPKRKENPDIPEIPEPGVPEVPLPGFPVPGFPDVAVPIVPELPLPELPEIPVREKPKDPRKGMPLPGHPVPIFPDIFFPRSPATDVPETATTEPAPVTLCNHSKHKTHNTEHSILNPYVQAATWHCYIHQKGQNFGVFIPAMSMAMLSRNYIIYILRSHRCKTFRE